MGRHSLMNDTYHYLRERSSLPLKAENCKLPLILDYLTSTLTLGAIHKLRHTLRGGGGRRSVTLFDKEGGGILNYVTSHFKNSIKAILHV